jgi:hypothetical protein
MMHIVNDNMWREALVEAISAHAGCSIFGYGFASAGRPTLALVVRIYQHVEPCPFTSKPGAVLRFFDGSKVKSAVCFYQKMLVTINELDGHSLEAERIAVLKLTIEQAQAELDNLLSYQESCDSSGGSVKVVLVVTEIDKLNNTSWGKGVVQQLLQWAHAATSRFVWIGLTALLHINDMQSMAQKCLVPVHLPRAATDCFESIINATVGHLMYPSAVKLFLKPATGSVVSIAIDWCVEAVNIAIQDNSAGQVSLEQLGLACRDADKVNCFLRWFNPSIRPFFKWPAVHKISGNDVLNKLIWYPVLGE